MKKTEKWYTSVTAIIISFIVFWPVGIALLITRFFQRYGKYVGATKTLIWTGVTLIFIGLVGYYAEKNENNYEDLWVAFIFLIPGIICAFFGFKRKVRIKLFNKYLQYINTTNKVTIVDLCNKVGNDYDTTMDTITDMINKEIIDAYIENDEIIFKNSFNRYVENTSSTISTKNIELERTVVKCHECGAKNTVEKNKPAECEYCGTILQ